MLGVVYVASIVYVVYIVYVWCVWYVWYVWCVWYVHVHARALCAGTLQHVVTRLRKEVLADKLLVAAITGGLQAWLAATFPSPESVPWVPLSQARWRGPSPPSPAPSPPSPWPSPGASRGVTPSGVHPVHVGIADSSGGVLEAGELALEPQISIAELAPAAPGQPPRAPRALLGDQAGGAEAQAWRRKERDLVALVLMSSFGILTTLLDAPKETGIASTHPDAQSKHHSLQALGVLRTLTPPLWHALRAVTAPGSRHAILPGVKAAWLHVFDTLNAVER